MSILGYLLIFISLLKLTVRGDLIDSVCDGNCLECFKNSTCIRCIPKMFLDFEFNQCVSCSENCVECESVDICLTCETNYNLETDLENNRVNCSRQNPKMKFSKTMKQILLLIVVAVFICLPMGLFGYKNYKKSVQTLKEKNATGEENIVQGVLLYLKQEEKMIQLNRGEKLPINVINQLEKLDTCHSIEKIEIN